MRLAVLSDVHAVLPPLEAVLDDIQHAGVDGLLVAGDLTAGPQPDQTIRLLLSLNSHMIAGNNDLTLLRYIDHKAPEAWYRCLQFSLLRWGSRHIHPDVLAFLRSLPCERTLAFPDRDPILLVHGSPGDPYAGIDPEQEPEGLEQALAQTAEAVLVCGHTHIPWIRRRNGKLALNPGAVCGGLNGDPRAQYALLSWDSRSDYGWQAELRSVAYDHARVREAFKQSGLLEEGGALAQAFLLSMETGANVAQDLVDYAFGLAHQAGYRGCETVPDAIWEQAGRSFSWGSY